VDIYSTKAPAPPAIGLLHAVIDEAERDPDDIEAVHRAIALLRQRQLRRADVQAKVASIFEARMSHWGQG
jgi:hypothetical protein